MEFAFDFDELGKQCVHGEAGYPGISNLDNDVHPMFKIEKFRIASAKRERELVDKNDPMFDTSAERMDQNIYERILPGLRLATLFLEHSGAFFSQVLQGELEPRQVKRIIPGSDGGDWRFLWINVIEELPRSQYFHALLLNLWTKHVAENILFYFDREHKDDWADSHASYQERCRYTIAIGRSLQQYFCEALWHQTKAQTRRYMNFQLAATLIHELAHVAWYYRWWDDRLRDFSEHTEEGICSHDEEQVELGQSWENWFFKGNFRPLEITVNPPLWAGYTWAPFTRDCENSDSISYPDATCGGAAVSAYSINQFFQKNRWEKHTDKSEPFTIDLTPLNSLTHECWIQDVDESYTERLTVNHESQTDPRRRLREDF
jgi:hypothetical protein